MITADKDKTEVVSVVTTTFSSILTDSFLLFKLILFQYLN